MRNNKADKRDLTKIAYIPERLKGKKYTITKTTNAIQKILKVSKVNGQKENLHLT